FTRNYLFSQLRIASAVTLMSAAAAMAFVAGGDRLVSVGSPSSQLSQDRLATAKIAGDPDAVLRSARTILGEDPVGRYEAYKSAARTYPADVIPPSMVQNAKNTFLKIATQGDPKNNNFWLSYGPLQNSIQPGVLSFSGATNTTASRDPVLVIAPTCVPPGSDAFLGRSVGKILVDPTDPNHIYAASALGVRGLSHVIGNGGTTRTPPNANAVGLYESTDGGATFTEVWNGNGATFGVR